MYCSPACMIVDMYTDNIHDAVTVHFSNPAAGVALRTSCLVSLELKTQAYSAHCSLEESLRCTWASSANAASWVEVATYHLHSEL